ncbi:hypothetical protein PVAP13_4KG051000, partial [Panicum virgatum]
AEHPNFDASFIYECVGRMTHGKLGIVDESISVAEKEGVETRKRSAQPHFSAREKRLERENEELSAFCAGNNVLAAIGELDYDALAQETATRSADSKSEGGLSKENGKVGHDGAQDDYGYDDEEYNWHEEDMSFEEEYKRW